MTIRRSLALAAVGSLTTLVACGGARMLATPLSWSPGDDLGDLHVIAGEVHNGWGWGGTTQVMGADMSNQVADAFAGQQLQVMPLTDGRANKDSIGSNLQKDTPRPVTTTDNVADFVSSHISEVLKACRIPVVTGGATRVLKGDLSEYFVKEDNRYEAAVMIHFSLTDAGGREIWQGSVRGTQNKFGHSFDASNYNEALSDATVRAVHQLLMDPAFLMAAHKGSK